MFEFKGSWSCRQVTSWRFKGPYIQIAHQQTSVPLSMSNTDLFRTRKFEKSINKISHATSSISKWDKGYPGYISDICLLNNVKIKNKISIKNYLPQYVFLSKSTDLVCDHNVWWSVLLLREDWFPGYPTCLSKSKRCGLVQSQLKQEVYYMNSPVTQQLSFSACSGKLGQYAYHT